MARLDLETPDGAFFGLLGPNGAGRTTLIGLIGFLGQGDVSAGWALAVVWGLAALTAWSAAMFATGRLKP
ncbi:hypothetical protein [Streptomyces anandii]|uniref:hypothetical protein n=1 Tax=Streptomyces anandii TaxID=285454 RepID=UPI0037A7380B